VDGKGLRHLTSLSRTYCVATFVAKLTAGGMTQTDQIRSGGSYLSQSDLRVHFGLGSATKIDSVEIRWPSGASDTLSNLRADQFYSVLEGKGIVPAGDIRPSNRK